MIKKEIQEVVINAINQAVDEKKLGQMSEVQTDNIFVEKTRNAEFGDYAVNVSPLSKFAKLPPVKIAEVLAEFIKIENIQINIIGGFINFKLGENWLNNAVKNILDKKENFGKNNYGKGEKVILEYVSANPTGPLHIGHGRWAAVGSSLASLMSFSGYDVFQEFYINDAGNQINNLGKSLWLRILQAMGEKADFPTDEQEIKSYYPGEYLAELAEDYLKDNSEKAKQLFKQNPDPYNPSKELIKEISGYAKAILEKKQKDLLSKFGVNFDKWYSETSLHKSGKVEETIEKLKNLGELYEQDGALWFKSTKYGDDQDRVIIKNDGAYTYLTADIAYHFEKIERGFERLINIWGADHHGYVARMKASIEALGKDPNCLEVLLGQLVNLIISGEQVRMGKRKKMLTLEDLIDEVGIDATRYWMIMRSIDTTLDFDVDLAKSCSDENPVYYVQYAHARASSILRNATQERLDSETKQALSPYITTEELNKFLNSNSFDQGILKALWKTTDEKELESTKTLILKLESFEDVIFNSTRTRTPYQIARYIQELASDFHHFYTFSRVLNVEEDVMKARLALVFATKQVIAIALGLLGVKAPESM